MDDVISVDARGNGLRNQGVRILLEALRGSHRLSSLDLSCNVISDAIGRFLLEWVHTKPALTEVTLLGTNIDITIRRKLYSIMQRRREIAAAAEEEARRALAASMPPAVDPAPVPEEQRELAERLAMKQLGLDGGWDIGRWFPGEVAKESQAKKPSLTSVPAVSRTSFEQMQAGDLSRTVGAKPRSSARYSTQGDSTGGRTARGSDEMAGGPGGAPSRGDQFARFGRTLSHPAPGAESDPPFVPTPPPQDKRAFEATFPRSNQRLGNNTGY
eukprot:jgi/Mesvir1/23802/Mv10616-RA.2